MHSSGILQGHRTDFKTSADPIRRSEDQITVYVRGHRLATSISTISLPIDYRVGITSSSVSAKRTVLIFSRTLDEDQERFVARLKIIARRFGVRLVIEDLSGQNLFSRLINFIKNGSPVRTPFVTLPECILRVLENGRTVAIRKEPYRGHANAEEEELLAGSMAH